MFQLPISGHKVTLRQPTGEQDLLLQETNSSSMATSLALVSSLTQATDGDPLNWHALPVTDLEAAMLWLRHSVLGNTIQAETHCIHEECRARVDVAFNVDEFMANRKPKTPRGIKGPDERGWFQLVGATVTFRLPSCGDVASIQAETDDEEKEDMGFARLCISPPDTPVRMIRRIDRAMQMIAAPLSGDLAGVCPECQSPLTIRFDVVPFVLREMRAHAAAIYQDIHLLALHYKWPEQKILDLPRKRRMHYAEMIRAEGSVA